MKAIENEHGEAVLLHNKAQQAFLLQKAEGEKRQMLIESFMNKARICQQKDNFKCASENAKQVLNLEPENADADELYQTAIYAGIQQKENLKKADKILKDGQKCLAALNYSCAIAKSESALEFVPNHKKALQLKKDATESMNKKKMGIEIN